MVSLQSKGHTRVLRRAFEPRIRYPPSPLMQSLRAPEGGERSLCATPERGVRAEEPELARAPSLTATRRAAAGDLVARRRWSVRRESCRGYMALSGPAALADAFYGSTGLLATIDALRAVATAELADHP
jgi:hypothetical protein